MALNRPARGMQVDLAVLCCRPCSCRLLRLFHVIVSVDVLCVLSVVAFDHLVLSVLTVS